MAYIYIHHTGCGTSRKGLALLQENGIEPDIRKYMTASDRLTVEELQDITKKMGADSPRAFLRPKDAAEHGITDDWTDEQIYAAMIENPKVMQRPIGINGNKAVLGRPNEKLLDIV
ncbi:MAG: ArsC/Spx/MgsR family protein [Pseudomonadota bacterium]